MNRRLLVVLSLFACGVVVSSAQAAEWKAGVAKTNITPTTHMWMAGYGSRTKPAEGKLNELWAKALVIEDASGKRVVLITLDTCGIDRKFSNGVRDRLRDDYQFERESIAISCSHTHSGPVVGDNLRAMNLLDMKQQGYVTEYTKKLSDSIVAVTGDAIKAMAPAKLSWGIGKATFAVNRRNNEERRVPEIREKGELKGPVDHDLPVLTVTGTSDDKLNAVVFGYACHATVTAFFQWSGDWPGVATTGIEKAHPGTIAMSWIGCGGDQNPLPRRSYELLQKYGDEAAAGVEAVLASKAMKAIPADAKIVAAYSEIDLPFGELPTKEKLESDLKSTDKYVANRAKILLGQLERDGKLSTHYPYPIQLWRLGPELKWVFLGGEVVVDYSLRLKRELGVGTTWVGAYMNDVMAYIPSLRVLNEGGYEGEVSMVYYARPTKWGSAIEELIVKEAHRQVDETAAAPK